MLDEQYALIGDKYKELSEALAQPDVAADAQKFQALLREHARLEEAVVCYSAYQKTTDEITQTRAIPDTPDMADMVREELRELEDRQAKLETKLRLFLIPRDPSDDKNVVMEVRAGAGGEEACLVAALLVRMYTRYAERHGFTVEPVSTSATELGGVKEAVFTISGVGVFSRMKFEYGVHRIQRVPVTEAGGRIHTSTATVAVLPEAEDVEVDIRPQDLRIDVYRSTGHGGQCVNTTDSAVRITHLPTGVVVTCQDQKSQIKNRDKAMRVLRSRLYDRFRTEKDSAYAAHRRGQVGTGERSERIRSYNYREGRVTDHRLGLTLYKIDAIMDGDLDEFIDALTVQEQSEKLAELRI